MYKYFLLGLFVGVLCPAIGFSQSSIQLGFDYSMGRTYTVVDYAQADAENLSAGPGLTVPVGLEIAWSPTPHWRIGTGISVVAYETRVSHSGIFQWDRNTAITNSSIPLEISYRIYGSPERKKSILLMVGGSYDLIAQSSGRSGRSSGWWQNTEELGSTITMGYETVSDFNISLRFGIGQEWSLGKRNRFSLQAFARYNLGLMPIFESDFLYWDQPLPEDYRWEVPIEDVMPEPLESYNSIRSWGSYFTLGFKFYYHLARG